MSPTEDPLDHALVSSHDAIPFSLHPPLTLLPLHTNLYETPASWLLERHLRSPPLSVTLTSLLHDHTGSSSSHAPPPDFVADNHVLRNLLSWQFSDRMVSVVVHRIGSTLVLQKTDSIVMDADRVGGQYQPCLVSGFEILRPREEGTGFEVLRPREEGTGFEVLRPREGEFASSPSASTEERFTSSASMEEQARLRQSAAHELLGESLKKKSQIKVKRTQLESKLHCKTMESAEPENGFLNNTTAAAVSTHEWRHKNHSIALKSDLLVYSYKSKPTSLFLRGLQDDHVSKAKAARLFLDNVMAGVPQVAVCWHDNGLISKYEVLKTQDIPTRLNGDPGPLDVGDIERNATSLLSFLKFNCQPDLSTHWLFRGRGDRIARLWKLDPKRDESLDSTFRDKVLFDFSMLCLRSCAVPGLRGTKRERLLLETSLDYLDSAAESVEHGSPRLALRSALRERLADIAIEKGTKFEEFSMAYDDIERATKLIKGELSCFMTDRAMARLQEREIVVARLLGRSCSSDSQCDVAERALMRGLALAERMESTAHQNQDLNNLGDFICVESIHVALTKISLGEVLFKRAKHCMHNTTSFRNEHITRAGNYLEKALEDCFVPVLHNSSTTTAASTWFDKNRVLWFTGNAWNELGKLRLAGGAAADAKEAFYEGIAVFRLLGDHSNIAALRSNVALTYQIAFKNASGADRETKKTLLNLALGELVEAKKELNSLKNEWTNRLGVEISKTHLLWAAELEDTPPNEALEHYRLALDAAPPGSGEAALVNFHMGCFRKVHDVDDFRLSRRHLERAVDGLARGSAFAARAQLELAELVFTRTNEPKDRLLKSLLRGIQLESYNRVSDHGFLVKFTQLMPKLLGFCEKSSSSIQDRVAAKRAGKALQEGFRDVAKMSNHAVMEGVNAVRDAFLTE